MDWFLGSIKKKLRGSFFALVFLAALGGSISFFFLSKVLQYQQVRQSFNEIVYLFSEAVKNENTFLLHDRKEVKFLESAESEGTAQHAENMQKIFSILDRIETGGVADALNIRANLVTLRLQLQNHQLLFKELKEAYFERGFKDHGLEGEMRSFVHKLQNRESPEEKVYAFSLRRHEKDFMMRKDDKYVDRIKNTSEAFINHLETAKAPHHTPEYVQRAKGEIKAQKSYPG